MAENKIESQLSLMANDAIALLKRMNETFPGKDKENLKVVLMAAIRDGMWVALNEVKNSR